MMASKRLASHDYWFIYPWIVGLLAGATADFLARSPGDASLLLAGAMCAAAGLILLKKPAPAQWVLEDDRRPNDNSRLLAFALMVLSALAVFGKISEDVVERETLPLDPGVSLFIHHFDTPALDVVMRAFSVPGQLRFIACVAGLLFILCWRRKDFAACATLVGAIAVEKVLTDLLKLLFQRPRPTLFREIPPIHNFSFPSGHAIAAVGLWGIIAVVVGRLYPAAKRWVYSLAAIQTLLIGYSRVYLGAHWLTDVLGGFAVGAAIFGAALIVLEAYPPSERARPANAE